MHLPTETTAVYHNSTDWNILPAHKGAMVEPPSSTPGSTTPPGPQKLWWTERLIFDANQEFPGELGKGFCYSTIVNSKNQKTRSSVLCILDI